MIVVEMTEDKFGQAMKDITCIEEKLEGLKHIFENESMGYRNNRRYAGDEREYRDYQKEYGYGQEDYKHAPTYRSRYL